MFSIPTPTLTISTPTSCNPTPTFITQTPNYRKYNYLVLQLSKLLIIMLSTKPSTTTKTNLQEKPQPLLT